MAEYIEVCETAVRRAGSAIMDMLGRVQVREKGRSDLVTEADLASQEIVRRTVLEAFPDHGLVGEEDRPSESTASVREYRWVVDPLDGTTNYVHRVPHFCVSLALERHGELLVGAVLDPALDECFTAVRGRGARLNGTPIRASRIDRLADSLVAVGFPNVVTRDTPDLLLFNEAVMSCQSMRRTGSAALNLAYVACGRFDAAWAFVSKIWDFAAGALLIEEAGGVITRLDGSRLETEHGTFLASGTRAVHAEILGLASYIRTPR